MNLTQRLSFTKKKLTQLFNLTEKQRNEALYLLANNLVQNSKEILLKNHIDISKAQRDNKSDAMIDRLILTDERILALAKTVKNIAHFPQVVREIISQQQHSNGMMIKKERIPLGVMALIFESRPNVVIETLALALKSGNALVLKGGKEAYESNKIFYQIFIESLKTLGLENCFILLEDREDVNELLKMEKLIDVVIPRGGNDLISFVKKNATMPVLAHDQGVCHLFVDESAKKDLAIKIVLNAKTQRPGVCNALESLIIHKNFPQLEDLLNALVENKVTLFGDKKSQSFSQLIKPHQFDYSYEYLNLAVSVKIVDTLEEAIEHIQVFGTQHTEGIISESHQNIEKFLSLVDASCLVVNASTRFNDGEQLGLGSEIGISTQKLHAYGPMGLKEMTTTRFIVMGNGQVRI